MKFQIKSVRTCLLVRIRGWMWNLLSMVLGNGQHIRWRLKWSTMKTTECIWLTKVIADHWGWRAATPKGWLGHPFSFFFFEFFLNFFYKKISIFIYFLINLYFFYDGRHVSPSYWRHVALTWHLTESVKNFNRIWRQGSICNYCISQGPPMNFLNYREWKIIMVYHRDQRCNYPRKERLEG
jgi:hypothetical protein